MGWFNHQLDTSLGNGLSDDFLDRFYDDTLR